MVFVVNNSMKLSSQAEGSTVTQLNGNATIPKSPSFHSGLDLVANKSINISKFSFASSTGSQEERSTMNSNGNNMRMTSSSSQPDQNSQTIFSFSKFFSNANPLNNLNIASGISSSIRQTQQPQNSGQMNQINQQNQANNQMNQNQLNQMNGNYYKTSNVSTMGYSKQTDAMKYTSNTSSSINNMYSLSAANIASSAGPPITFFNKHQQQHSSPSRARDRNLFDKVPNQDLQALPPMKGLI